MRAEDIDNLEAGRELDALVAEKVMGLIPCSDPLGKCEGAHAVPCLCWGTGGAGGELRSYSTDIAAAWEVVEKLAERGDVRIRKFKKSGDWRTAAHDLSMDEIADTAPLAICRAALKAVEKAA